MKTVFIVLSFFIFIVRGFPQDLLYRSYSVKEGLASNIVYKVLVDKKGFVWFATDAGVSLFDGTTFTNFSASDGLADNEVPGLAEDGEGRIWFLCYNKQPCFYYKGKFFNAANFKELQKIKDYNWHIVLINEDEVWFISNENIYRFKNNSVRSYTIPQAHVLLIANINGTTCALTDSALFSLDRRSDAFQQFMVIKHSQKNPVTIIDLDNGRFAILEKIGISNTLLYYSTIDMSLKSSNDKFVCRLDKEIIGYIADKKSGVLKLSLADNTIVEKSIVNNSLQTTNEYKFNSVVSGMAVDHEGNQWFTLLHNGVQMYPRTKSYKLKITGNAPDSSAYYSVAAWQSQIIAGSNNNSLILINKGRLQGIKKLSRSKGNNKIIGMKTDKGGRLWLGTNDGLNIYDTAKKQFYSLHPIIANIKDLKYDTSNNAMLIASSQGLYAIFCNDTSKLLNLSNERAICVTGSLTDTCWYGTLNGLYLYNGKISMPEIQFSNAFNSRISCLETDRKKRLWIGTSSNGVFVVNHGKVIYHLTRENGMTSDIAKNIFIDENNEAWVSTNLGISRVVTDNNSCKITKYNDKNCLAENDINNVLVANDTVYAVSNSGIIFFNKNNASGNYSFPVYITAVKTEKGPMPLGDSTDSTLTPGGNQNTISISFAGLSFLSSGAITYHYSIKELNDTPLLTSNNSVTFSGLAPGTYNFYVSATDIFGNKSISPAHLQFTILPRWYQLVWLRLLGALALVGIAILITFSYSRKREKRKRLQSELNQTISKLELEAIRSQINPHFIFNCLNAIQNAIYNNNVETASYFINRFAKLMRNALMLSKESFISLEEEYNFINNYLEVEKLRHNSSFDYEIEIDSALNKSVRIAPAFVLQPFTENAINHGLKYLKNEKGFISLKFIKTDKLEIVLEDNGIGMNASNKINLHRTGHSPKGMELIKARIESLNKIYSKNIQIKITDNAELNSNKSGTTVIISLDL